MPDSARKVPTSDPPINRPPGVYYNPAHQDRIREWVQERWEHGNCPVCGASDFATGPVVEIPSYNPRGTPTKAIIPVFTVACTVCGYTLFINAIVAKVVRAEEEGLVDFDQFGPGQ